MTWRLDGFGEDLVLSCVTTIARGSISPCVLLGNTAAGKVWGRNLVQVQRIIAASKAKSLTTWSIHSLLYSGFVCQHYPVNG